MSDMSLHCVFLFNSLINSEEIKNPGALEAAEAPFGTDTVSAMGRDGSGSNGKEKVNKEMSKSLQKLFSYKYDYTKKIKLFYILRCFILLCLHVKGWSVRL